MDILAPKARKRVCLGLLHACPNLLPTDTDALLPVMSFYPI